MVMLTVTKISLHKDYPGFSLTNSYVKSIDTFKIFFLKNFENRGDFVGLKERLNRYKTLCDNSAE